MGSTQAATHVAAPIGLALEIDDGVGMPVRLAAGRAFYLDQLDLRAAVTASVDEGVAGLDAAGELAGVPWAGVAERDEDFLILPNGDGTFTRRRFYQDALWMDLPHVFLLSQHDASGAVRGLPRVVFVGPSGATLPFESFFVRRMRAIQWTRDCPAPGDCTGADDFEEEALVELREAMAPGNAFALHPETAELRLYWSMTGRSYAIPVEQEAAPAYAYGFAMEIEPIAASPPAQADGSYLPGTDVTFRVTLRDGAGGRLHPEGSLPTYNEVAFGENPAGIQYYRAFFDPSSLYWRRKHRERMFMVELLGPVHRAQPIRSVLGLPALLTPGVDVQTVASPAVDGVAGQYRTFPTSFKLFGGAFDPTHAAWADPVPDTWTFHIPADAEPGTYNVVGKARRVFLGEDRPASVVLPIQVGSATPTTASLGTGNCNSCHTGAGALGEVLHALSNRATCAGCHTPLPFEHDAPVYVRLHYLHSRSPRFPADLADCTTCHVTAESIQRTSKSACLSCHGSYPPDHVAAYGEIVSPYVGGGEESFAQCTNACHATHPGSGP